MSEQDQGRMMRIAAEAIVSGITKGKSSEREASIGNIESRLKDAGEMSPEDKQREAESIVFILTGMQKMEATPELVNDSRFKKYQEDYNKQVNFVLNRLDY